MREVLLLMKATRILSDKALIVSRRLYYGTLMVATIINVLLVVITDGKDYSASRNNDNNSSYHFDRYYSDSHIIPISV